MELQGISHESEIDNLASRRTIHTARVSRIQSATSDLPRKQILVELSNSYRLGNL